MLAAVVATSSLGYLGSGLSPLFVGSLMNELQIDEAAVGWLGSAELSGFAVGALALAPFAARISRRGAATAGALVAALGFGCAAFASTTGDLAATRIVAGLGCGLTLAAGNAAAAAVEEPDRLFARVLLIQGALGAVSFFVFPLGLVRWGYSGGYAILCGSALLAVPLVQLLPLAPDRRDAASGPLPKRFHGSMFLLGIAIFYFVDQALWFFNERIGDAVGLSLSSIGIVLGLVSVAGLLGPVLANRIGASRGRMLPMCVGFVLTAVARLGLALADGPVGYVLANLVWTIAILFTVPYLFGLAAALDAGGRWVAAATAAGNLAIAGGPGVAGALLAEFGTSALAPFLLVGSIAGVAVALPVIRSIDRERVAAA